MLELYGRNIPDNTGNLKDVDSIVKELEEVESNFDTSAMSDHQLFLCGKKEALQEVIEYLKRV